MQQQHQWLILWEADQLEDEFDFKERGCHDLYGHEAVYYDWA
jgi:hypothetical protein